MAVAHTNKDDYAEVLPCIAEAFVLGKEKPAERPIVYGYIK